MTPTSNFGWQDLVALVMVFGALAWLCRGIFSRSSAPGKGCGSGGGGCQGCRNKAGLPEGPGCSEPVTVGIGGLTPTVKGVRESGHFASAVTPGQSSVRNGVNGRPSPL